MPIQHCSICNTRIAVFNCNVTEKSICNYCCDKFQLNQFTDAWSNYFDQLGLNYSEVNNNTYINKCMSCEGLSRCSDYTVFAKPEKGFGYSLLTFEHKGSFVFSSKPEEIFLKRIAYLERARVKDPDDYLYLAESYYYSDQKEKAINLLEEAINEKKYEDARLYLLYSRCLHSNGHNYEALKQIKKADALEDSDSEIYRYYADILRSLKDYDGSIYYYKKALEHLSFEDNELDLFFEYNYFGLAISYSKAGLHDKVIEVSNQFLEIHGGYNEDKYTYSTIYELLSIAYLELDDLENAETNINLAKEFDPVDVNIVRLEGIIIGRKFNQEKIQQYREEIEKLKENTENKLVMMEEIIQRIDHNVEDIKTGEKIDILDLKPNFMGMGINLNQMIKSWKARKNKKG